jgi:transcriptional regulator with XRE-family HTH domain
MCYHVLTEYDSEEENMMDRTTKLRKIRKKRRLGLNMLARKANINPAYLSALERGLKNNPSKKVMDKLAEALAVNISDLF